MCHTRLVANGANAPDTNGPSKALGGAGNALTSALRVVITAAGASALIFAVLVLAYPAPFASAKKSQQTTHLTDASGTTDKIVVSSGTQSPSDGLIGSIAGVGAALLLIAAFFPRITSVKAFGVEIGLSEEEKNTVADAGKSKVATALQDAGVPADRSEGLARNLILFGLDAGEGALAQKATATTVAAAPSVSPPAPIVALTAPFDASIAARAVDDAASKRLGI
jgi:hypothetical protein